MTQAIKDCVIRMPFVPPTGHPSDEAAVLAYKSMIFARVIWRGWAVHVQLQRCIRAYTDLVAIFAPE